MRMSKEDTQNRDLGISDIDKVIHEPVRLSILAYLYVLDSADALFLKNQIGLTWGNFSTHLKRLRMQAIFRFRKSLWIENLLPATG